MTQQDFSTKWPLIKTMMSRDHAGLDAEKLDACRGERDKLIGMLSQGFDLSEAEADGAIAYYEQAINGLLSTP